MPICTIQYYGASETESRNLPTECAPPKWLTLRIKKDLSSGLSPSSFLGKEPALRTCPLCHKCCMRKCQSPLPLEGGAAFRRRRIAAFRRKAEAPPGPDVVQIFFVYPDLSSGLSPSSFLGKEPALRAAVPYDFQNKNPAALIQAAGFSLSFYF